MSSVLAACFRCDWMGYDDGTSEAPTCPRCGTHLYVEPSPADVATSPKYAEPSPKPTSGDEEAAAEWKEGRRGWRSWTGSLAALVVLAVLAALLTRKAPDGGERLGQEGPLNRLQFPATTRFGAVSPTAAAELAPHSETITFVAVEPTKEAEPRLLRLWRLDLRSRALVPGPVVAEVRELRLDPRRRANHLAFLTEGGGLFSLEGFHAARPTWISRQVSGFDFAPDGSLIYTSVQQEFAPRGSGTKLQIRVVRTRAHRHTLVRSSFTRRLQTGSVEGLAVWSPRVFIWGSNSNHSGLVVVDESSRHVGRTRPGEQSVLGVGRNGEPLGDSSMSSVHVSSPVAWSPNGAMVATIATNTRDQRQGLWVMPTASGSDAKSLVPVASPTWVGPGRWGEAFAGFSADSKILFWPGGDAILALNLESGRRWRIDLPDRLLQTAGPLVAS